YAATTSGLDNVFGGGINLSLHYIQRITHPFAADFTLGAFYLGSTSRDDITTLRFGPTLSFDNVAMRVLRFTAAPMIEFEFDERTDFFISAGGGLYILSLLIDDAFREADVNTTHFGLNVGGGAIRQLSKNWFVDVSLQVHKFWTSDGDLFFDYSEGDGDPLFYQVSVGAMLRLF
ncbi:MAG: hypothetical protein OEN01_07915, partial [Candidatus Krumholzibacteria bacterium]|nr:hypothetical protein [Candidatus Krumholzibacteria bacterium]